jgi:hypothetical protein
MWVSGNFNVYRFENGVLLDSAYICW